MWGGTFPPDHPPGRGGHFNPPTPCGVGPCQSSFPIHSATFQSTHPVWGGTPTALATVSSASNFNPPTPCGVGPRLRRLRGKRHYFNPPTPCGVGRSLATKTVWDYVISIHPPRVGWDMAGYIPGLAVEYFNPPTPCGVGLRFMPSIAAQRSFQSTHPVWGGTMDGDYIHLSTEFQSTHPVWGGTQLEIADTNAKTFQSTHPVWGGTLITCGLSLSMVYFNPPTPCGVGHPRLSRRVLMLAFQSTHPVWGGTYKKSSRFLMIMYFNPPTPCGVGLSIRLCSSLRRLFQSTHPVWGGTSFNSFMGNNQDISIHPPRVGWDTIIKRPNGRFFNFNPPTPCGVGLGSIPSLQVGSKFQSTHPVWGGTL